MSSHQARPYGTVPHATTKGASAPAPPSARTAPPPLPPRREASTPARNPSMPIAPQPLPLRREASIPARSPSMPAALPLSQREASIPARGPSIPTTGALPIVARPSVRAAATEDARLSDSLLEALWFGEDDHDEAREGAARGLAAQVARIQGLRPFPAAAQRLITILSDPSFKQRDVDAVMQSDPSLAARTLAVSNSPLFKTRLPCRSIEHATRRLGARNLRDIAIGVSAMSMFHDLGGSGARLRDHCVGVGAIIRVLADLVMPEDASALFLSGLLHDVGQLLLLQTNEVAYATDMSEEDLVELERRTLGYDHAVLGGVVVAQWRIPSPTDEVIAFHHHPARALEKGGKLALSIALLGASDKLEQFMALGAPPDEAIARLSEDTMWSYADLGPGDLRQLWPALVEARSEMLSALA